MSNYKTAGDRKKLFSFYLINHHLDHEYFLESVIKILRLSMLYLARMDIVLSVAQAVLSFGLEMKIFFLPEQGHMYTMWYTVWEKNIGLAFIRGHSVPDWLFFHLNILNYNTMTVKKKKPDPTVSESIV